ncbi:MAG TPA: hypothetical protein VLA12_00785 [Planctomycetaceae bacterium]|nr:hypothetical protein [Planctomycetaceae bacterium]
MKKNLRVAYRDCEHCRHWLYDEETGKIHRKNDKDVPRGNIPTPCDDPKQGCPKGHYDKQKTLSVRNQMCYQYIKEGEAVNWQGVPHDGVTRRNKAFIDDIEKNAEKAEHLKILAQIGGMSSLIGGGHVRR